MNKKKALKLAYELLEEIHATQTEYKYLLELINKKAEEDEQKSLRMNEVSSSIYKFYGYK